MNGRLTRDDWIALARKALIASGIDDVKVDLLARRMKVTRGSFYHHFAHRQELLDALLEDWATNNRREIEDVRSEETGVLELFRVWLREDRNFPAFDIAVRVWARKSRSVAAVVHEIDEAWINLLQGMLARIGIPEPESFVRARIMYFHQVGYYALSIQETLADRVKLAPYYYAALTGMTPPDNLQELLMVRPKPARAAKAKAG